MKRIPNFCLNGTYLLPSDCKYFVHLQEGGLCVKKRHLGLSKRKLKRAVKYANQGPEVHQSCLPVWPLIEFLYKEESPEDKSLATHLKGIVADIRLPVPIQIEGRRRVNYNEFVAFIKDEAGRGGFDVPWVGDEHLFRGQLEAACITAQFAQLLLDLAASRGGRSCRLRQLGAAYDVCPVSRIVGIDETRWFIIDRASNIAVEATDNQCWRKYGEPHGRFCYGKDVYETFKIRMPEETWPLTDEYPDTEKGAAIQKLAEARDRKRAIRNGAISQTNQKRKRASDKLTLDAIHSTVPNVMISRFGERRSKLVAFAHQAEGTASVQVLRAMEPYEPLEVLCVGESLTLVVFATHFQQAAAIKAYADEGAPIFLTPLEGKR